MRHELLQPIHIKLLPSTLLLGLLLAISMVACAVIVSLPITLYFKLPIIALIFVSSVYFICRDALLLLPWSWQSVNVDSKSQLTLINQLGQKYQPNLAGDTFINANLLILNVKREGFKLNLPPVILLGSEGEDLRRLRVWLIWVKHQPQHAASRQDLAADAALD